LLPPMVQDFVAADHLARFVLSLVRDEIDLAAITSDLLISWRFQGLCDETNW
jgi:hypothetical protein